MTAKEWVRAVGIVLFALGVMCFPIGFGVSPKRDLSLFFNFADVGAFWKAGVVLVAIGVLVLIVSAIIPSNKRQ